MRFVTTYTDPGITQIHVISVAGVALDLALMFARELVRELSPFTMYAFDHGGCALVPWFGIPTVTGRARPVKKAHRLERGPEPMDR